MFVIDQKGARVRPICRECLRFHKPENCPKERARRKRAKQSWDRFMQQCLAIQASLEAQRLERQA